MISECAFDENRSTGSAACGSPAVAVAPTIRAILDPALNPANVTRSGSIPNSFARLFTSRIARLPSAARAASS